MPVAGHRGFGAGALSSPIFCGRARGFTLIELLVATAVFALLLVLITLLFNNASTLVTSNTKRMDADAQARQLFGRMAIDFSQMVKREDVDFYMKSAADTQAGNDRVAFFCEVPGYYPSTGAQSPYSLVSYRIKDSAAERLSKGLLWAGSGKSFVHLPLTIKATWPQATDATAADEDYEGMGADIFRFEYYYLLRDGSLSANYPGSISDVAAIGAVVAVIDPKSRVLVSDSALEGLAGQMGDFKAGLKSGELEKSWRDTIDKSSLPNAAKGHVRVYGQTYYLYPLSS